MKFIPGLQLNEGFYRDVVAPLCNEYRQDLVYSAALMGYGSDVLGVDTAVSMDHNWGPRLQIFLSDKDHGTHAAALHDFLSNRLPFAYRGFPVNFSDPRYDHTQAMTPAGDYPINHLIEIVTPENYLCTRIGIGGPDQMTIKDWLTMLDQNMLEITSGLVFHDGLGRLRRIRESLLFYPRDIRLLRMAALWQCVWNEEAFIGRCREIGDPLGVKTIAARLVDLLVKIVFYIEKKYIPYSKWRGLFFQRLKSYNKLYPVFLRVVHETESGKIEDYMADAYTRVVALHNSQADLPRLENEPRRFFGRPYKVIFAETIKDTLLAAITDETVKNMPLAAVGLDIKLDGTDFRSSGIIRRLVDGIPQTNK
jgi:hypothetical protein